MSHDLFDAATPATESYNASQIEVLEGLEPVRRRPGMYIGGTDERALHHLAAEVIDNSMDEAVAGHANRIEVDARCRQPADRHRQWPRHPDRPAPEIPRQIGARGHHDHAPFGRQVRGQGLCDLGRPARRRDQRRQCAVERHRDRGRAQQTALSPALRARRTRSAALEELGPTPNRRGTSVSFIPDPEIFGDHQRFKPQRLYRMARSKAYLFARRRNPLEMRARADRRRYARRGDVPVPRRPCRPSEGTDRHPRMRDRRTVHRPPGFSRRSGPRRMGDRLALVVRRHRTAGIATPSRPPPAAPTRRACARR